MSSGNLLEVGKQGKALYLDRIQRDMGLVFWEVTTVFILVLLSSSTFPAGSIVYKSSLGTIPCPLYVHDYKINVLFPVETPWHD